MSDLSAEISAIKKELQALKAGFTGSQTRFSVSVETTESFFLTSSKPVIIRAEFPYQDFPQLHVRGYVLPEPAGQYLNFAIQKDLYEWFIPELDEPDIRLDCLLLSQYEPTVFVMEDA